MRSLIVAALAAAALAACTDSSSAPAEKADGEAFRVALLTPGPISDAGWNALAYDGLSKIRAELGAEVSQVETKTPAEFEEGFRDYARRGFVLVFGHGFEFQQAAAAVAPDFPDTVFITTSGNTVRPNVAPLRFMLEEATYLEGMAAGLLSKSGVVGAVGGMEIPSVKSTVLAFEAGAKAVRPDVRVLTAYIGNWEDVGAAKEAALAQIQQGADLLFHNADAAGLGVFRAAQERNVLAFGANRNQNDVAPTVVLASAVIDIPQAFLSVAREVREKRFHARVDKLGMADNVISLQWNDALRDRVPDTVRARVEAARQTILDGSFTAPSVEF
jgi:basic membrane lipoprotein Med (substrate-binding protein (PBP1-ABC) superfamily)